jgi:hypothetical protein
MLLLLLLPALQQNADDNSYPAGTVPSLEFVLLPDAIAALNNEAGLTAADLHALCDIGASTKLAKAHIGYKGIGFKSVFKVWRLDMACGAGLGSGTHQLQGHGVHLCLRRPQGCVG